MARSSYKQSAKRFPSNRVKPELDVEHYRPATRDVEFGLCGLGTLKEGLRMSRELRSALVADAFVR